MRTDDDFYSPSKLDLAVIALIVFACVFWIVGVSVGQGSRSAQPKVAVIYHDHESLGTFDLRKTGVVPVLDGRMKLEFRQGRVRVLSSDCPQHICVNTGWIQYGGQTIVCVPNKVIIEVRAKGPSSIDAVAN